MDPTAAASPQLPRVFVLGSSLTLHFGPYLETALRGHFHYARKSANDGKRAEDNLDIPQGASGGDSGRVLAYLRHRRERDPIPADVLLLSCGLHDLKTDPVTGAKQVPPEQFQQNLQSAIEETARMGLTLVWLRITPVVDQIHNSRSRAFHRFSADVDRYNRIADTLMQTAGVKSIDLHALCSRQVPEALIDHVHYHEPARREQAEFIARELIDWWAARSPAV